MFEPKYQKRIEVLVKHITRLLAKHYANCGLKVPSIEVEEGRRYTRLWVHDEHQKRIWGFVDQTNGDVLMAASWRKPAKIARGNVFDRKTWTKFKWTGPQYLRDFV